MLLASKSVYMTPRRPRLLRPPPLKEETSDLTELSLANIAFNSKARMKVSTGEKVKALFNANLAGRRVKNAVESL